LQGLEHWTHEAGIQYLRKWTSLKSDFGIRLLRQAFLEMLKDDFGIVEIIDPKEYFEMPLHAQIDLGGGNTILPYVVNEMANFRIRIRANYSDFTNRPQNRIGM
jgi:hypothetical protein